MADEKTKVATTADADPLPFPPEKEPKNLGEGAEEPEFVKVNDEAGMPEAANGPKKGLFSIVGQVTGKVTSSVSATWTTMKSNEGKLGAATRTADGWMCTAIEKGKEVDEKLGVSVKVKTAAVAVKETTVSLDEKLHVSETVKGAASTAGQTVGGLNEKYHVTTTVKGAANGALDKVSALDAKYKVSSSLQSGVEKGFSSIFAAVRPGQAPNAGVEGGAAEGSQPAAGGGSASQEADPPATLPPADESKTKD